jgi:hypothetical protein
MSKLLIAALFLTAGVFAAGAKPPRHRRQVLEPPRGFPLQPIAKIPTDK